MKSRIRREPRLHHPDWCQHLWTGAWENGQLRYQCVKCKLKTNGKEPLSSKETNDNKN